MPQNLSSQKKVEANSDNNTASNHSSDCVISEQKKKECCEKESDAQVSFISFLGTFLLFQLR